MEFPGVLKRNMEIPGVSIEKQLEFPGTIKKIMLYLAFAFGHVEFWPWNFQGV